MDFRDKVAWFLALACVAVGLLLWYEVFEAFEKVKKNNKESPTPYVNSPGNKVLAVGLWVLAPLILYVNYVVFAKTTSLQARNMRNASKGPGSIFE